MAAVLLTALACLWPPIVNGGPFYMPDTPSYVRAADSGFYRLFGVKTAWTQEYLRVFGDRSGEAAPTTGGGTAEAGGGAANAAGSDNIPVTLLGRSIFYGALLYAAELAGSFWFVVVLQSLLAAVCIYLTFGAMRRAAGREPNAKDALVTGLIIAAATPLGFFTGYLMPDVFGGFALLAVANLVFLWPFHASRERWFWFAVLLYALLVHNVNLLLVLILACGALVYVLWRGIPLNKPMWIGLGACIAGAFAGQAIFGEAVDALTGAPPVRPPFVAMRLIADGPGQDYLKRHCPQSGYIYCRVVDRQDLHSDTLLWSTDARESLFRGLPPHEQRLSAAQERPFLLDVVADQPLAVLRTAIVNSLDQLFSFNLSGFNYSTNNRERFAKALPSDLFESLSETRAFTGTMPLRWTEALSAATALASLLILGAFFFASRRDRSRHALTAFCVTILAGIAVNAALCGALSGPKGRYELRIIWVLPLIAGGLATTGMHRRRSSESRHASSTCTVA